MPIHLLSSTQAFCFLFLTIIYIMDALEFAQIACGGDHFELTVISSSNFTTT